MAESNATQVILTDDGIKIIKAQNTADNAVGGVTNLNDPNLMNVIEKQNNITQFAGLTSQYNVLVQNAKDDGIDTTAVTTAYNDLNKFMADVLADPNHASDVDRVAYKKYQDAYNEELAKIQSALQNNANNKFNSAASATSQAASTANAAKSAADSNYAYANSEIAVQSTATAKAQSAADNAFSQAKTAIDTGNATSQAVTDLKDGSTMTIAELANGLGTKVANSDYASYKDQTASQIGELVTNGAFSAYKQTTADLISEKVSTSAFSAYQATTAKAIESKVESSDFNTYKQQTADAITSKVANSDFSTYKTQTANDIDLRVIKKDLIDEINLQAGNSLISSSGQLTLSGKTIYFDTANPVIIPSANIDSLLVGKKLRAADISANTFSTNNETFTVDKNGAITAKNMTLIGGTLTSPTINASTINGSTINGTTFHGGDIISNSNNTAKYYPMSIDSSGTYNSTTINNVIALRASVQSGAIIYDYRSMLPNDNGKYIYSNTVINGQGVTIESGHTDTKDSTFNAKRTGSSYISLTPSGGLMLSGPNSNIDFAGMYMNPYGNIVGKSSSAYWQVSKAGNSNSGGGVTARFGIDTGDKGTINFYRPLFVDEIGGFTSSNGHALFIHGDDNGTSGSTGQMIFRKDGRSAQVVSASIYNRTYSSGSSVNVTSCGTLGRITSASKYKLDITKETSISPANRLLSIDMSSWIDKSSAELLADSKTNGTELSEPEINVNRHYGLIAEDLIKAGLDEFVIKGDKGQAEGIEYDRLWITLIPKIRQLSNDQIQNKMTIAKLGSEIEELKQGR
ncbi:hypothetical protein KGF66_12790 [Lactiplantibacillus pentosus]|uniref:Peptidase S74 domain-containing protein n=1 Tax=Lactiplantibacillus pentosus TaxID=1589 RepID=A0AAW8WBD3_LACPE|nr:MULTISPECIES: gp58-like family protein [Lactiplantibacillus]MBU7461472.1 hypothetical protein [Lactiplantibacillus pentosus]MBU7484659.1 hypothetical protein [Lactiplantibacillus sp. 30.2.29]MBU7488018.1 hypothetical protein [Lactiplantibacillus pentosus]MBU7501120.1 hypothetical protein [Lactiplantibacillus pentosus]MBU7507525.1 hypothetical protein [Lactiplantibacillus pentosus]